MVSMTLSPMRKSVDGLMWRPALLNIRIFVFFAFISRPHLLQYKFKISMRDCSDLSSVDSRTKSSAHKRWFTLMFERHGKLPLQSLSWWLVAGSL